MKRQSRNNKIIIKGHSLQSACLQPDSLMSHAKILMEATHSVTQPEPGPMWVCRHRGLTQHEPGCMWACRHRGLTQHEPGSMWACLHRSLTQHEPGSMWACRHRGLGSCCKPAGTEVLISAVATLPFKAVLNATTVNYHNPVAPCTGIQAYSRQDYQCVLPHKHRGLVWISSLLHVNMLV